MHHPAKTDGIKSPLLFATKQFADTRGWFGETYNERTMAKRGIVERFVQDNQSMSERRGTIRGLHFQIPPMAQAKIVRVIRGSIFDVVVDVRRGSPTYGRFVSAELSEKNSYQIYVPIGFAHGCCALEDHTEILYKVSNFYSPQHEGGIIWNDPAIHVSWPANHQHILISDKDAALPLFNGWESPFTYDGVPLGPLTLTG